MPGRRMAVTNKFTRVSRCLVRYADTLSCETFIFPRLLFSALMGGGKRIGRFTTHVGREWAALQV